MRAERLRRAMVVVSVVALGLSVAAPARSQALGGSPTHLSVEPVEATLAAGQPAEFEWTYSDPDAFTVFRHASIDHGDGSRTHMPAGLRFPPCDELQNAHGTKERFSSVHVYDEPGTYDVVAQLTTRQQVCLQPLTPDEAAEVRFKVTVRPAG